MAVAELVDAPAVALAQAVEALRRVPAPLGQEPGRLAVLARAVSELQGVYLRELAAAGAAGMPAAQGWRGVADLLVGAAGLPAWRARRDAGRADRLAVLPGLLDALADGAVELPAAEQLLRAWRALPPRLRDEGTAEALIALAGLVDLRALRGKVDELVGALAPDVTDADLAAARESGELVLVDVGAQTRVSGHTDAVTGEWLREVLQAKAEADRGLLDPRRPATRLLDALLDCLRAAVSTDAVPAQDGADPTLVVVASVDDLTRTSDPTSAQVAPEDALADLFHGLADELTDELAPLGQPAGSGSRVGGAGAGWSARTRAGVPVGPRTLGAVCCTARLTRLVLGPLGAPLDSSPAARQLSRRERRALEHRAGYRCERAGCGRPAGVCVPHHVVPWALGGPSTQANTVLLCRACHHLLHDRDRELDLTGSRRIGPRGWVRGGPEPP